MNKPIIFIDEPINNSAKDIIGLDSYVDSLSSAIDDGAQMIAITSGFGYGKSSILELLKNKGKNYEIIKLSMWTIVEDYKEKVDTKRCITELHKTFLFNLLKEINIDKGDFLLKRFNKKYGTISLNFEDNKYKIYSLILLAIFIVFIFFDGANMIKPIIENFGVNLDENYIKLICYSTLLYFSLKIINKSELIYSYKTNNESEITEDELVFLYNKYILKKHNKKGEKIKYVIAIEDLDRIDNTELILPFLKELRKYYVSDRKSDDNNVTFVVSIANENVLSISENKLNNSKVINNGKIINKGETPNEDRKETYTNNDLQITKNIYLKLFDFVMNLPEFNMNDYRNILSGLLKQKKNELEEYFGDNFDSIINKRYWNWIIKGKDIDIRIIKNRLNNAFILHSSLFSKFNDKIDLNFEKCIFASYLITEYPCDFAKTEDDLFSNIIDKSFLGDNELESYIETIKNKHVLSSAYIDEIKNAVENKIIDKDYYYYFYNYPKNSKVYTSNDIIIRDAILYGQGNDKINEILAESSSNDAFIDFATYYQSFNHNLKDVIFKYENLYKKYLEFDQTSVVKTFRSKVISYKENEEKLIKFVCDVLSFDIERTVVSDKIINSYCWQILDLDKEVFLKLRLKICELYKNEITKYHLLFEGNKEIIVKEECELLDLDSILKLINISKIINNLPLLNYIINRFSINNCQEIDFENIKSFFDSIIENVPNIMIAPYLAKFMKIAKKLYLPFEEFIRESCNQLSYEDRINTISDYVDTINNVFVQDENSISESTIKIISELRIYEGFSRKFIDFLYAKKQCFLYFMSAIFNETNRKYLISTSVINSIKEQENWLISNNSNVLYDVRRKLISMNSKYIYIYKFLFNGNFPSITNDEIELLCNCEYIEAKTVIEIVPISKLIDIKARDKIIDIYNKMSFRKNDYFNFMDYYTETNQDVLIKTIKLLDFNHIYMPSMNQNEIDIVFDKLNKKMGLMNNITAKLDVMKTTKTLFSKFEIELNRYMLNNNNIQSMYIDTINNCHLDTINDSTVSNLMYMNRTVDLSRNAMDQLYKSKYIKEFIILEYLSHGFIDIDYVENEQNYLAAIKIMNENGYLDVKKYLCENQQFRKKIILNEDFINFDKDSFMLLCEEEQTKKTIEKAFSFGTDYASLYYSKIKRFDKDSESFLLSLILNNLELTQDSNIYNNIYNKLNIRSNKVKYTNARKKYLNSKL